MDDTYIVIRRRADSVGLKQDFKVDYIYYGTVFNGLRISKSFGQREDTQEIQAIFERARGIASPVLKMLPTRRVFKRGRRGRSKDIRKK